MSFYKKYELERLIADGEAKTFRAIENSSGRLVYLHLFNPSGQRILAVLKAKLASVPGKPVAPLLDIGEFAGSTYAVTLPIEPFSGLREWVALNLDTSDPKMADPSALMAAPMEATPVPPLISETPITASPVPVPSMPMAAMPMAAPPSLVAGPVDEFTKTFMVPLAMERPAPPVAVRPTVPPPATPVPPRPTVPPPAPSAGSTGLLADEPGSFTQMFEAVPAAKEKLAPAAPPGLVADQPGEFTRIFEPGPAKHKQPAAPAAGEFTKLFESPPAARPTAQPAAPFSTGPGGGEFTRLFQAPLGSREPVAPAASAEPVPPYNRPGASLPRDVPEAAWPASSAGEVAEGTGQFTRLFGSRLSGESIDIEKEHASAAQSAPHENKPFQQAGDFTRIFGPTSAAADAAGPAPGAPPTRLNTSTRLGSASGMFGTREDLAKYSAEVLKAPKPADAGPSEYTRMFGPSTPSGGDQAAPAPAAPKPPNPEMQAPKKSRKNLIIIVSAVAGVLILAIVLIIVLGRGSH